MVFARALELGMYGLAGTFAERCVDPKLVPDECPAYCAVEPVVPS